MQNHKRILKMKEENIMKNQNLKQGRGITLVALVVTVVVLIILATITITIVVGENGLINRAQQAKTLQENAKDKEELDMILLGYNLSNETKKAKNEGEQTLKKYLEGEEGISNVKEKGDNLIVTFKGQQYTVNKTTLASGAYQTEGLNATDEEKVVNALKSETKLLTVDYEPTPTDSTYIVPDKYSGVNIAEDDLTVGQNFTQAGLLGTGNNKLRWHVLSTDEDGVNLVSDVTKSTIKFADSPGYDNCLYYLDKVSKEFFSNEAQYGVTKDRVHALRLTDIKKAAEQMNAGYKVGERDWSWETDFVQGATTKSEYTDINGVKEYTGNKTFYPGKYVSNDTDNVIINNPLYDELIEDLVIDDIGIQGRIKPSKLTINSTYFSYVNNYYTQKNNLGNFIGSRIGKEIFSIAPADNTWLASRCINASSFDGGTAGYSLRFIWEGTLYSFEYFCKSNGGNTYVGTYPFRLVVSVPASHISVADDGTVSLK